jgi:hypothetical protein
MNFPAWVVKFYHGNVATFWVFTIMKSRSKHSRDVAGAERVDFSDNCLLPS